MKKTETNLKQNLDLFKQLSTDLQTQDFLLTWQHSVNDLKAVLLLAEIFKELHRTNRSFRVFDTGMAVSIFRDQSTRTRFSFASAANALGLSLVDLDEEKSQIAHGETVRETANMISFLTEVIGIRDDVYLGEGNKYMREVAAAIQEGFDAGVLHKRPSVINLQCDLDHPTQTLADLLHLKKHFGSLNDLKGRKITISWAYSPSYGKPLSVPQGLIGLMTRFGMNVTLAHPQGYSLTPEIIELAKRHAQDATGSFSIVGNMEEAFDGADVVYPKSWAPYWVMERRTELLKLGDGDGLHDLEKECLANNAKYRNWECDASIMKRTLDENTLYMHCLPADITGVNAEHGEVSQDVFEKYRLDTYRQASYKPFIIAALIFLSRIENAKKRIDQIITR
ncbi:knotted carbamoyltransferase YgeW [candidate division LCP-89 bacterium B3_LCP]|uniref:Knotted carbamoyltransferase YgeW n=1 Tax=candidate division LCP-89 bacterium B3_LCP TaxID=2012998 RepID=A0A532URQ9_UNCL8|nr:MAG: knotted carbamoyltransferase YgeW [candidate division LCP-89 bacterium B3_LCP]